MVLMLILFILCPADILIPIHSFQSSDKVNVMIRNRSNQLPEEDCPSSRVRKMVGCHDYQCVCGESTSELIIFLFLYTL